MQASFRLLEYVPKVGELVERFRARALEARESLDLAQHALLLRYPTVNEAPVDAETLLKAHRPEDEGASLWATVNRLQQNLVQGGVSDFHRDRRGKLRSVRALRGIDSKVGVNKGLWSLAERLADGQPLEDPMPVTLAAQRPIRLGNWDQGSSAHHHMDGQRGCFEGCRLWRIVPSNNPQPSIFESLANPLRSLQPCGRASGGDVASSPAARVGAGRYA